MQLSSVTLSNFRCFERLEVPLHPRLTVLVAENGGGKTA
ncbi:MAG TPA: AAA family ATPase, partial [Armatimonadota bacterium]|nr:AAA family ATPase [Armatimonadota bacterium]